MRAGHAAAGWAFVFALRGAYWALGGTVGLGTLSPGILGAAADRDPSLFAALWTTVVLEIVGVVLALALVGPRGETLPRRMPFVAGKSVPSWLPLVCGWGAGTLLAGHGGLFVGLGLLAVNAPRAPTSTTLWNLIFWGPWFTVGGILFMVASWSFLHRSPDRRTAAAASIVGAPSGASPLPVARSSLRRSLNPVPEPEVSTCLLQSFPRKLSKSK